MWMPLRVTWKSNALKRRRDLSRIDLGPDGVCIANGKKNIVK